MRLRAACSTRRRVLAQRPRTGAVLTSGDRAVIHSAASALQLAANGAPPAIPSDSGFPVQIPRPKALADPAPGDPSRAQSPRCPPP
jgi:hypothetical protein